MQKNATIAEQESCFLGGLNMSKLLVVNFDGIDHKSSQTVYVLEGYQRNNWTLRGISDRSQAFQHGKKVEEIVEEQKEIADELLTRPGMSVKIDTMIFCTSPSSCYLCGYAGNKEHWATAQVENDHLPWYFSESRSFNIPNTGMILTAIDLMFLPPIEIRYIGTRSVDQIAVANYNKDSLGYGKIIHHKLGFQLNTGD